MSDIFYLNFLSIKYSTFKTKENGFLCDSKCSFCTWDIQILEIYRFKLHGAIKCVSMKKEIHFTE